MKLSLNDIIFWRQEIFKHYLCGDRDLPMFLWWQGIFKHYLCGDRDLRMFLWLQGIYEHGFYGGRGSSDMVFVGAGGSSNVVFVGVGGSSNVDSGYGDVVLRSKFSFHIFLTLRPCNMTLYVLVRVVVFMQGHALCKNCALSYAFYGS